MRKVKYIEQRKNLGNRNSYSKTDKDACFLRMKNDSFDFKILSPGYNMHQANCSGYLLHFNVSNLAGDTRQLPSFVNKLKEINALRNESTLLADAGYGSLANYEFLLNNNVNYIIPYMNQRFESKLKYRKNPVAHNKFVVVNKNHVIYPANQILAYVRSYESTSPSGFKTLKDQYHCYDCSGFKFVNLCSKNGHSKYYTYDSKW